MWETWVPDPCAVYAALNLYQAVYLWYCFAIFQDLRGVIAIVCSFQMKLILKQSLMMITHETSLNYNNVKHTIAVSANMLLLLSCIWTNNSSSSPFTPYRSVNAIKEDRLFISSLKPELCNILSKYFLNILKYCTSFVSEVITEKFDQNQNEFEISAKTMFAAIL